MGVTAKNHETAKTILAKYDIVAHEVLIDGWNEEGYRHIDRKTFSTEWREWPPEGREEIVSQLQLAGFKPEPLV